MRCLSAIVLLVLSGYFYNTISACCFFFNDTATTEIYTLSLHDALPICADDRLLELCTGLVRVPSENPPGDTRAIADHLRSLLTPLGADVRVVAGQPTLPNVVAVARGRRPGRRLVFNGHLDTFVVGDRARWSVDPLGGVVKDGRVYGR